MSEVYGRKYPLFVGYFVFALFQIPVATAENVQTILVCRFLSGLFGSSPLSVVGGALVDLWPPVELGIAMSIFAGANFVVSAISSLDISDTDTHFDDCRVLLPVLLWVGSSPKVHSAGGGRRTSRLLWQLYSGP